MKNQVVTRAGIVFAVCAIGVALPVTADTIEVGTASLTFVPPDVVINAGDSIHWSGLTGHTVAEVDDAVATVWNSGFHSPGGDEFTLAFNTAGLFYYICEPHVGAGMRGTVTVNEVPIPTVSEWGMAVLVLAVMTAGTIAFGIRRRTARLAA